MLQQQSSPWLSVAVLKWCGKVSIYLVNKDLCCAVCSRSVISDSLWLHGLCPPGSSVHGDSPGENTGVGCHALLQGIFPTRGSNPGLLHCRWIILPHEPPGKPQNTGVGSLSLLQGNVLTHELNWGLLHCRQILYHLSYQRSPKSGHQFSSITWSCPTLCDRMDCSTLNFTLSFKT